MSECIRWKGVHNNQGRPVNNAKRAPRIAYRVIYEEAHGPLPKGWDVHHTCENGWCVNLEHLEAVEHIAHSLLHRSDFCPKGHPYDEENTYVPPGHPNQRQCKVCRRNRNRIWMREHKNL